MNAYEIHANQRGETATAALADLQRAVRDWSHTEAGVAQVFTINKAGYPVGRTDFKFHVLTEVTEARDESTCANATALIVRRGASMFLRLFFEMRIQPAQHSVVPQHAVGRFQHPVILIREI